MDAVRDIIRALLGDATPEERAKLARLTYRIIVSVSLLWSFGWLSGFGLQGFAKASEVDDKIQSSVEPIRAQLGAITTQLATQDEVLKSIRADQLAQKLRELKRTCCLSGADERVVVRMEIEIERAQLEYIKLTGGRYPLPECGQ